MSNKIYNQLEDIDNGRITISAQGAKTRAYLKRTGQKEPLIVGYYIPESNPKIKIGIPAGVEDLEAWKMKMETKYKRNLKAT